MLAAAAHAVPYVHEDGTAFAIGVGLVTLAAAGLAVAVAFSRPARGWRLSWLLMAWLCLLLAVDEALPLAEWITTDTGIRWWKIYALPVAIGLIGWLLAAPLLTRELSWHSRPVRLLVLGECAWAGAYGVRLIVFVNDHGGFAYLDDHLFGHSAITQAGLIVEAVFKLAGAALLVLALAAIRGWLQASERLRSV